MISNVIRSITLLTAAVAIAGCVAQIRNHGYAPTDAELEAVIVGADTRATVEDVIGRPSTSGVLTESAYYYLSSQRREFGVLEPAVIDRQLVAISFDGDGVVSNVERFTLEDGRVVPLSRRVTESSVQNTAFLRQLLGNIGRFDASRLIGGSEN